MKTFQSRQAADNPDQDRIVDLLLDRLDRLDERVIDRRIVRQIRRSRS